MRHLGAALLLVACNDTVVCGPGTALRNGECVTATPIETCSEGGIIIGGACFPDPSLVCGPNTTWDPVLQRCVGQTVNSGCSEACGTPGISTVCIQGRIFDFVQPTVPAQPTPSSHLTVRAYDPITFVSDPVTAIVLGQSDIGQNGCYKIDSVSRPPSGLIAISVTDAASPQGGTYAVGGAGAILQTNRNVQLDAYFFARTTTDQWSAEVGVDLLANGMWIGQYLDVNGNPVAGVTPTWAGSSVPPDDIFCFSGSPTNLTTADRTDVLGLCAISPDNVAPHSGMCDATCNVTFPQPTGGSTAGVVFFQIIKAM